jgi:ribonuclease P protein component
VNRNFRLTQAIDFKRVRRFGRSYAHPLIVLIVSSANGEKTRFGIYAGRSVGNAVQRNKAKRLLREALRPLLPKLKPGWKAILIPRKSILKVKLIEIQDCLHQLCSKANLIIDRDEC